MLMEKEKECMNPTLIGAGNEIHKAGTTLGKWANATSWLKNDNDEPPCEKKKYIDQFQKDYN